MRSPTSKIIAASAVLAPLLATLGPARAASEITIVRDSFGVPRVYGATAEDVSYALTIEEARALAESVITLTR